MHIEEPSSERRLLPLIKDFVRARALANVEGVFVLSTFLIIGFILYFVDQKLSFLNLYFIPILLAAYFMNTRSAMLGSLLSILVVTFFVVLNPDAFYQELSRMGLYLHVVIWGSFLILTGYLVGEMNGELRERFLRARKSLLRLNDLQEELSRTNQELKERNRQLESNKSQVESVLFSAMDPLVAKLIIDRKLHNEKRALTVLTADLADFNAKIDDELPENLVEELNRLFTSVEPILAQYRGHLDKYSGAGLTAEFGLPFEARQHALLAGLAALKIQERVKKDFPWKMRIGVVTGPALIGLVGSERRKNYTAIGDTVSLAHELRAVCPKGGIVVNGTVHEHLRHWCRCRRLERPLPKESSAEETKEEAFAWGTVSIRRKASHNEIYEILSLKDPLENPSRVPAGAAQLYRELRAKHPVPERHILPVEALEGAVGHSQVTAALSAALADALGLGDAAKRLAFLAGCLHDIGKRGVPESALGREDALAPGQDEAAILRDHVRNSEKILAELGLPREPDLIEAIAQHHERTDGSGYPDGLKSGQISLTARILQIADAYETMTAWRPFHDPMEPRSALEWLGQAAAEGRFDPKIMQVFVGLLRLCAP